MAARAENYFYTNGFDGIESNVNEMHACSAEPTTYTEAITTYSLGKVAMSGTDFTEGDGTTDGRKLTVGSKTITATATGTATHLALVITGSTQLVYATTCTSVGMTNTENQDFSAWDITLRDPTTV